MLKISDATAGLQAFMNAVVLRTREIISTADCIHWDKTLKIHVTTYTFRFILGFNAKAH